ncbi:sensor histidine kinase, partial [Butyricicoccus sp. 1XD8-22]
MKKMVEDLLAFNQFAANVLDVNCEVLLINDVVKEAMYSWEISQDDKTIELNVHYLEKPVEVAIDPIRFQQIMTNLLNNAQQAMEDSGKISVVISDNESSVYIDVIDVGNGIPREEQDYIFERFYRGNEKKYRVRGLGLGLS